MTAETITDEQIRELRSRLLRQSDNQMTNDTDMCAMALWDPDRPPAHLREDARILKQLGREHCAEIYNKVMGLV